MIFYIIVYSWIDLFMYYLGILITTEHKGAFLFFVYLFVYPLVSLCVYLYLLLFSGHLCVCLLDIYLLLSLYSLSVCFTVISL